MLADLDSWLQPVQLLIQLDAIDLDRVVFTRLNERFYPAFQLARLLLEGQTVQLSAGGQRAFAFVFDMDRLFEQFIANLLYTHARHIWPKSWQEFPIEFQGGSKKKHLVLPPNPGEKPMFQLEPDILLGRPGTPHLIIDTKNKVLPIWQPYRSVAEADVYQMLAYATQFRCPNILLLYPRTVDAIEMLPKILSVDQTSIQIFVATLNLHQPLDRLENLIQEFRSILEFIHSHAILPSEMIWPA
jgi:5-methylcytosine-specific restriction enzyme subunit McrC